MREFTTAAEYRDAKTMLLAHNKAVTDWLTSHKTNAMPAEVSETMPYSKIVDNDFRSAIEVWEFNYDIPDRYFLYISESKKIATTWTGQLLGSVIFGREFRDNFGGKRVPVTVYAVNGCVYYGTYYKSAGDYARIKRAKNN
jgi:hypothetical protein